MKKYRENYKEWLKNVSSVEKEELLKIQNNDDEIKNNFSLGLEFGTAGIRGIMGLGTSLMNIYTIDKATKGVANYINSLGEKTKKKGVLIAYDTRNNSFEFALEAARVLGANGVRVYFYNDVRPVPMCSFGLRKLGCSMGIMITASHNPKEYNGYKVFGSDGAQISGEEAVLISDKINDVSSYFNIEKEEVKFSSRAEIKSKKDGEKISKNIEIVANALDEEYYDEISKLRLSDKEIYQTAKKFKVVYTPIHGAGAEPVVNILKRLSVEPIIVKEQFKPDGDFSTVALPNPEYKESLQMAVELANLHGVNLVIGTDPDCDRMGVAVRDERGEFIYLTGNQIGAMLFEYILLRKKEKGELPSNGALIKTIVTTNLASKIARSYGVETFDVLTGFKYIGEKIKEWELSKEFEFLFGYEESYGFLAGTQTRDKDGVVACMLFVEMACYYKMLNIELYEVLENIFKKYGYFTEITESIIFKGIEGNKQIYDIIKKVENSDIWKIADRQVVKIEDFKNSVVKYPNGKAEKLMLPKSDVFKFDLGNDEWVCIRPSGTEPKLKIYSSACANNMKESKLKSKKYVENLATLLGIKIF